MCFKDSNGSLGEPCLDQRVEVFLLVSFTLKEESNAEETFARRQIREI